MLAGFLSTLNSENQACVILVVIVLKYILSVYGPTALCWALAAFSVS
jgi:hypothetical protein